MRGRAITWLGVATLTVLAIGGGWYWMVHHAGELALDAYAVQWTARAIVRHIEASDGLPPRSWEDLRDDFVALQGPTQSPFTFEQLQERVAVDFDAFERTESDEIVTLKSGRRAHWEGQEPHALIRAARADADVCRPATR